MIYDPDIHHRHSIRLKDYDYSQAGAYFVTICAWQRECLFGEIVNGEIVLNDIGRIVKSVWCSLPDHFTNMNLDEFVIMPNHFHGILLYTQSVGAKQASTALPAFGGIAGKGGASEKGEADTPCFAPTTLSPLIEQIAEISKKGKAGITFALPLHGTVSGSFCAAVQNFKSVSTRKINRLRNNPGCPVWQRNYYERVVRNENELFRAREYIVNNPIKWELDQENPVNCQ